MGIGDLLHLAPVELEFSTKWAPKNVMPLLNLQFIPGGNDMHMRKKNEEFAQKYNMPL